MELQVSGKLKSATADEPSFKGFRIEALFDLKPISIPSPSSTARPITAESAPYQTAPDSAMSTSAEPPISIRVSALSDDAGNFTLVFPDQHEIATETVKLTVSLPAGRIIRDIEVKTVDLCDPIAIEVEPFEAVPVDTAAPKVNTPQRVAVDALFTTDAAVRRAITENLKSRRGESEAVAARVEKGWNFRPSRLSADELGRRHYVAPGSDPGGVLETVILTGVDALRSAKTERALTLRNTAELRKFIKKNQEPVDSLHGVLELGQLIEFIQARGAGPFVGAELTSTPYRADAEAEAILDAVGKGNRKDGAPVARQQALTSNAFETAEFVKSTVNTQMMPATAPEAQLAYSKIPNSADEDNAQKAILQSFELREGPTDVTSYHDFHTLHIAFEHVWTEIFDGQLASLGRELFTKYVELKDFVGSSDPDLSISTLDDLKRLIEQVKSLSNFTAASIPGTAGDGSDTSAQKPPAEPKDWTEQVKEALPPELRAPIEFFESLFRGMKIVTWDSFPLSMRGETIRVRFEENAVAANEVEIVMQPVNTEPWKLIHFREFDSSGNLGEQWRVSNDARDKQRDSSIYVGSLPLWTHTLTYGTLEFFGERDVTRDHISYYVLVGLPEKIKDRTRVIFTWSSQ